METGGALTALGEGALAVAGAAGAATRKLVVGTAWAIQAGVNAASHLLGCGAETGGGTDSDASRPSRATDVQTLNGMQESGAIDHFFAQQLRRQPQVYRIDTDSESEPQAQPRQQIRARPIRRQGPGPAAAHALRHQPGPHPGELRERTVPHQPAVPGRPRAAGHAVLRRPSHGERTGSCIMYKGWRT